MVETLFKTLNKTHRFTIKNSVEYYVKFTVPEKVIKRLEKEKDKHIFQVRRAEAMFRLKSSWDWPLQRFSYNSQMFSH